MNFYQRETHLKYHLLTTEPPLTVRTIDWIARQDLRRKHSILQYVTFTLDVYQVCHCVSRCVKDGSCSIKDISES